MKIWPVALGVGLAALLGARAAHAADLVRPVVKAAPEALRWDWTGSYIGLQGGGAWGKANHRDASPFYTGKHNVSGGLVGATWGYNWQVGNTVIGFESDASWAEAAPEARIDERPSLNISALISAAATALPILMPAARRFRKPSALTPTSCAAASTTDAIEQE